ncbi:hypothetical protein N9E09_00230 [bacterium]|nr:hypothetical protein [bacterium]
MAYSVKFRRGTTAEHASFTGAAGEVTVNTTTNQLVVHDGATVGGHTVGSGGGATSSGGGVTIYASIAARDAAAANEGDLAFLSDSDTLHINNGSEWIKVWAGPDEKPTWTTELPSSVALNSDGTANTLTVAATDPEGFDITYTYDTSPSNQAQATIVNNNDGTFTLTPSITETDAGSFTFRAKATDGIHVISTTTTAALSFTTPITFTTDSRMNETTLSFGSNPTTYKDGFIFTGDTTGYNWTNAVPSNTLSAGKKYFEFIWSHYSAAWAESTSGMIGVSGSDQTQFGFGMEDGSHTYTLDTGKIITKTNGTVTITDIGLGAPVRESDVIQFAYDSATGELWINKNNTTWWPSDPASGSGAVYSTNSVPPVIFAGSRSSNVISFGGYFNVGNDVVYTPPSGFTAH